MPQHILRKFQHKFNFQRGFKYSNITHDRYTLVLPSEKSTAITHNRYMLVLPWETSTAITHNRYTLYYLGRRQQQLHMTGTLWYYHGRCLQQFRSKQPSKTTGQLCKIKYSNITKHGIGGTLYPQVIHSETYHGYMKPRIIPNAIYKVI